MDQPRRSRSASQPRESPERSRRAKRRLKKRLGGLTEEQHAQAVASQAVALAAANAVRDGTAPAAAKRDGSHTPEHRRRIRDRSPTPGPPPRRPVVLKARAADAAAADDEGAPRKSPTPDRKDGDASASETSAKRSPPRVHVKGRGKNRLGRFAALKGKKGGGKGGKGKKGKKGQKGKKGAKGQGQGVRRVTFAPGTKHSGDGKRR